METLKNLKSELAQKRNFFLEGVIMFGFPSKKELGEAKSHFNENPNATCGEYFDFSYKKTKND